MGSLVQAEFCLVGHYPQTVLEAKCLRQHEAGDNVGRFDLGAHHQAFCLECAAQPKPFFAGNALNLRVPQIVVFQIGQVLKDEFSRSIDGDLGRDSYLSAVLMLVHTLIVLL